MAIKVLGALGRFRLEEGGLVVPLFPGIETLYFENERIKQQVVDTLCYIPPVWCGTEDSYEASHKLLHDIAEMPLDRQIGAQERIETNSAEEIEYYKQRMIEAREAMNAQKLRRKEAKERLAELRSAQENGGFDVTQEDVENLTQYLKRVKSVLGVRVDEDGNLVSLVRTAIPSRVTGNLYDMGDFEVILGVSPGTSNMGCDCPDCRRERTITGNGDKSLQLTIKCVRLPHREDGYKDQGGMYRLWFEGNQTIERRENGEYYIDGGYFCFGSRRNAIEDALRNGNVRTVFDLVIASLNDTQHDYNYAVEDYGTLIPEDRVEDFYMTSTKIDQ